jgi:hypothetical protein
VVGYTYTPNELETMKLINDYRLSVGLNALEKSIIFQFNQEQQLYD